MAWAWQLTAAPADKAEAEAMARGWLAEGRSHLSSKFHSQVRSVDSFPNFHVVQLAPEGFIITAADDELEPVLAFSDQGNFQADPENPLWIMLNKDLPARGEHLRNLKAKLGHKQLSQATASATGAKGDDAMIQAAQQAREKWGKYKNRTSPLVAATPLSSAAMTSTALDSVALSNPPAAQLQIQNFQIVAGHVQLNHDALESVSVYASYDFGQSWQVVDSGIVWPSWTSKQPVHESSCWYRIATDGIYDEMTVNLMRFPPPQTDLPTFTTSDLDYVIPPEDAGLASSKGSVSDIRVAPLVQSVWSQSTANGANCYNYYTPNNYVDGCVATALAQLMRYWQHPTAGIGQVTRTIYVNGAAQSATTRGGNGTGGAYNWSAMPLNPASVSYNLAQWQMIGALCYDAGVSVNMQYASGASGAYMYLCASALSSVFQYANAKYVNNPGNLLTPINSNLAAGCPVLLGISSSGGSGHAVVCDGFGYDAGTLYHHINMGWAGSYNFWYALPYLETTYNFNTINTIIYNIYPSGTGELLTGRVITSQGAPVSGATVTASASGQNYTATSDAKGYYSIKVPSAKTYTVTASKIAMGSATRSGVVIGTSSTSASGNVIGIDFTLNNTFSISAVGLAGSVWLRWLAPSNSGMPNNTVYIRHRTDRYPTDATDGTEVYTGTAQVFEHSGVDNTGHVTNFYTIWGDNGSGYTSLGTSVNCSSLADPGTVRLLWTRTTGEVSTWNLKASGAKKSSTYVNSVSSLINMSYWSVAGFNDIDRDGVSDILWTGAGGDVVYWLLNADGTRNSAGRVVTSNLTPVGYWSVKGFNDLNGDGTADILWTGAGGEVVYWLLNADGTRNSAGRVVTSNLTPAGYWSAAGFSDINGDRTSDILWIGAGGEVVYWLLNANGTRKTAGRVLDGNVTRNGYWTVSGFKDISRDGVADIVWRGQGGETKYWLLNANGTMNTSGNIEGAAVSPSIWTIRGVGQTGP